MILHIKRGDESQFLYETNVNNSVDDVLQDIVAIFNGRLKVTRISYEMEELQKHGTFLPLEMQGLTEEQVLFIFYIILTNINKVTSIYKIHILYNCICAKS